MASRNEKKLIKLREKLDELTRRIKEDTQERAKIEKEIEMLESAEITAFIKRNSMVVNEDLLQQLAIVNRASKSGYTAADMAQLFEFDNAENQAVSAPTAKVSTQEENINEIK